MIFLNNWLCFDYIFEIFMIVMENFMRIGRKIMIIYMFSFLNYSNCEGRVKLFIICGDVVFDFEVLEVGGCVSCEDY